MKTVKMLIDGGADVNIKNNIGRDALMIATEYSNSNIETVIIASRNSNNDSNTETVRILIDGGADVNITDISGLSSLMIACRNSNWYSNVETVKMLINAGANVNIKYSDSKYGDSGYTALMVSSRYSNSASNIETVKMLIDSGADIDTKDNYGHTALMIASKYSNSSSNIETVKILIDANADVNAKYQNCITILMMLLIKGTPNCSEIIIQLLHTSRKTLLDIDNNSKTAYDYYMEKGYNMLDEYHLSILKGDINPNCTKSARF